MLREYDKDYLRRKNSSRLNPKLLNINFSSFSFLVLTTLLSSKTFFDHDFSRLGTNSTSNIGSSENIKGLYESQRGRSERPSSTTKTTSSKPTGSIKPKQTTTSLVRQKASKNKASPTRGPNPGTRPSKNKDFEKQLHEFKGQQEAIEELKRQFNQLQNQVAKVSQNELISQENERLKDQLASMSQVMANIHYKVQPTL